MDDILGLLESLLGLLFYVGRIGAVPALIAYLAEKGSLRNGNPPLRAGLFALIAVALFVGSAVWMILDPEIGGAVWLFAFMAGSALVGVAIGGKAAQSDFRRGNKPS